MRQINHPESEAGRQCVCVQKRGKKFSVSQATEIGLASEGSCSVQFEWWQLPNGEPVLRTAAFEGCCARSRSSG
jgi:hypothetical protein